MGSVLAFAWGQLRAVVKLDCVESGTQVHPPLPFLPRRPSPVRLGEAIHSQVTFLNEWGTELSGMAVFCQEAGYVGFIPMSGQSHELPHLMGLCLT